MTGEKEEGRTFTFYFTGTVKLKTEQIWPDGNIPKNPRSEDVVSLIEGLYTNIGDFIDDWSLGKDIYCVISSSDNDVKTLVL